jgi:NAD(P)H-flavin reductase
MTTLTKSNKKVNDPMIPQRFTVKEFKQETHDTFTVRLNPLNGAAKFSFQPGQFNMLYVFGVGEVPISISGDPSDKSILVHTIRSVGSVTKALSQLKKNDIVGVRGPFGSSWPVDKVKGRDVVIVTGGIGLAPLRPAICELLAKRKNIGKLAILYGARTPEDILYRKEVEQWRSKLDLQMRVTVDKANEDWYGTVGVVTILIHKARFDPHNTIAFVCGPEIMMHFTIQELLKSGMKPGDIYISMERNMKCAIGFCGHCQYGPKFICKEGPVFAYDQVQNIFKIREI